MLLCELLAFKDLEYISGATGNHGYVCEGIAGNCYSSQVSISSMFDEQLCRAQFLKMQKKTDYLSVFFALQDLIVLKLLVQYWWNCAVGNWNTSLPPLLEWLWAFLHNKCSRNRHHNNWSNRQWWLYIWRSCLLRQTIRAIKNSELNIKYIFWTYCTWDEFEINLEHYKIPS